MLHNVRCSTQHQLHFYRSYRKIWCRYKTIHRHFYRQYSTVWMAKIQVNWYNRTHKGILWKTPWLVLSESQWNQEVAWKRSSDFQLSCEIFWIYKEIFVYGIVRNHQQSLWKITFKSVYYHMSSSPFLRKKIFKYSYL